MAIKKGGFITINYTCKVKESGEVVNTTIEEIAKKEGLHAKHDEEKHEYEPLFVIVGEGWVPAGVDEALEGMEVGQEKTVKVSPEKGFGVRDPSKMKLLPLRKFSKGGVSPVPGLQVEVDGKPALIRSVGAGRVQVDFNHPLSGKILVYELKVESSIRETIERVKAILHRRVPSLNLEKTTIKLDAKESMIEIPEDSFFIEGLQLAKRYIANDVQKYLPKFKSVLFAERFVSSPPPGKAEQKKSPSSSGKKTSDQPQQSGNDRS